MARQDKIKKAVALSYKEDSKAPQVVASGSGLVAEQILKRARENKVPVYEDEKLATILKELELGETIPQELYEIVAKILVFVGDMDGLYAKTQQENEQKGVRNIL